MVSGFEKLIGPYQNFLYVVQSYELFPTWLEDLTARFLPWAELFLGIFLFSGLWLKWVSRAVLVLFGMFIAVAGQAFIRGLPIDECGCFGQFISLPLSSVLVLDSTCFVFLVLLMKNTDKGSIWGLDRYCNK